MKKAFILLCIIALLLATACGRPSEQLTSDIEQILSEIESSVTEESSATDESTESTETTSAESKQSTTSTGTSTVANNSNTGNNGGGNTGGNGGGNNNGGNGGTGSSSTAPTSSTPATPPVNSEDEGFVKPYNTKTIEDFAKKEADDRGLQWANGLTKGHTWGAPAYTAGTNATTLKTIIKNRIDNIIFANNDSGLPLSETSFKLYLEPVGNGEYALYFLMG